MAELLIQHQNTKRSKEGRASEDELKDWLNLGELGMPLRSEATNGFGIPIASEQGCRKQGGARRRRRRGYGPGISLCIAAQIRKASHTSSVRPCKVTNDNSGQSPTSESILLDEDTLQQKLQTAIDEENYAEAAKIRDRIQVLQEDSKASVFAANAQFYTAFRSGDLATMQTLWARGENVCCVHPGASGISGYDLVMSSWEYVWMNYDFPLEIELKDVLVHVKGDIGYVTCVELIRTKGSNWGRQFATNVFERVDGQWLISVHHASPVDL